MTDRTLAPEARFGGFASRSGTLEFFARIKSIVRPDHVVLDFGCGRGAWTDMDLSPFLRSLLTFKGEVARYVGCDVDEAVLENPTLDEAFLIEAGRPLPFGDASFDVIISDFVFEHVEDPAQVAAELTRVLRPGGALCARTPHAYAAVSLVSRLVDDASHSKVLRRVQPDRKAEDVFPTAYKLNTKRAIRRYFPPEQWEDGTYLFTSTPSYFFGNRFVYRAVSVADHLLPISTGANLFVFLRKKT